MKFLKEIVSEILWSIACKKHAMIRSKYAHNTALMNISERIKSNRLALSGKEYLKQINSLYL